MCYSFVHVQLLDIVVGNNGRREEDNRRDVGCGAKEGEDGVGHECAAEAVPWGHVVPREELQRRAEGGRSGDIEGLPHVEPCREARVHCEVLQRRRPQRQEARLGEDFHAVNGGSKKI